MIVDLHEISNALLGGMLIGLSVTIMLLFNGRVTGISGILYGLFNVEKNDKSWRFYFILGLFLGGLLLSYIAPDKLKNALETSDVEIMIAGFLVGFGTVLGNGCTSGHGVCGVSRFSLRSLAATMTFIFFGIVSVFAIKQIF